MSSVSWPRNNVTQMAAIEDYYRVSTLGRYSVNVASRWLDKFNTKRGFTRSRGVSYESGSGKSRAETSAVSARHIPTISMINPSSAVA
jgi:hypothetical protein